MRKAVLLAVAASVAVLVLPASASSRSAFVLVSFRTPSGNIYCAYNSADPPSPAFLRCDIRSHLKPAPPRGIASRASTASPWE